MCGICGIATNQAGVFDQDMLDRMTATLDHRGPDDRGTFLDGTAGLGQTRLSIIDLSDAGHQPMRDEEGRAALAFNGEIYNFLDLRARLEADGHTFFSRCDTEVVLRGWLAWGEKLLAEINGMFAFALWESERQRLVIARDRFGIKPLYYTARNGTLAFGSEIKAILETGLTSRNMNVAALHEYLFYGNCLGANTAFADVHTLPPGHYLIFDARTGTFEITPYWEPDQIEQVNMPLEEAVSGLRGHLEEAVKRHLMSDVPVGVFLSGGIDSSCVTAFAARHYESRIKTYSVSFDFDKGVNELAKAKQVADHFGTEHHELHIEGAKLQEIIEALVASHDQPFSDSANIPLYLLCRELNGSPKVILQGDGGDEIFAGYNRYDLLRRGKMLQRLAPLGHLLNAVTPPSYRKVRHARMLHALGVKDPAMKMALLLTTETLQTPPTQIFSEAWQSRLAETDPFAAYRHWNQRLQHLDPTQRMLYTDTRIILPNDFLEKVDKSTMAWGIEVRVPLLDAALTQYAMALPSTMKVKPGQKKWLLRQALRGVVPDEILDAPKTGFGVPYGNWLRKPLSGYMKSVLLDSETSHSGLFDRPVLTRYIEDHIAGRANHGYILLKALNLVLWMRKYQVTL